jgi:hypothetical protein
MKTLDLMMEYKNGQSYGDTAIIKLMSKEKPMKISYGNE